MSKLTQVVLLAVTGTIMCWAQVNRGTLTEVLRNSTFGRVASQANTPRQNADRAETEILNRDLEGVFPRKRA